jgi:N-carbamoyl-L-amino-acid hydrolase
MREFDELWGQLAPIGRDPYTGGYHRFAYGAAELTCRDWFASTAADHGLASSTDRNGNLWARWVPPGVDDRAPALVLGSHLDSVPDGGAFDGPLGVVSAFAAVRSLRQRGWTPDRPLAIVAFADEEGAPFGVACAGSRLLTGELAPERARAPERNMPVAPAVACAPAATEPGSAGLCERSGSVALSHSGAPWIHGHGREA